MRTRLMIPERPTFLFGGSVDRTPMSFGGRSRSSLAAGCLALIVACGESGSDLDGPITCEVPGTCTIEIVSGDAQSGRVTQELVEDLVVLVRHTSGAPLAATTVVWTAETDGARVEAIADEIDDMAQASARATLGQVAGAQAFRASLADDSSATVLFTATGLPRAADDLEIVSGGMQSAEVGSELTEPLVVRAVDPFGNPVPDVRIQWRVAAGDGQLDTGESPQTDENGESRATATLGSAAGETNNLYIAESPIIAGATARFFASALAGPATRIEAVEGDNQAGVRNEALPQPLVAQVSDQFENPVQGVTVTFSALTDGGSVSPETAVTDALGRAQTMGGLGPDAGQYQFRATVDGAGAVEFAATAFPPLCSEDDWCWNAPIPQGNTINDSYAVSPTDVWIVGDYGTILRWNGVAWEGFVSGTTQDLNGVFGVGTDVWAVGDAGTLLRFDGVRFRNEASGTIEDLFDIWGTSASQVVVVGDRGTILTYDGTLWSVPALTPTTEKLNAVWGMSAVEVFVAGDRGTVLSLEGGGWTQLPTPTDVDLNGVWGTAADNVWLVGDDDTFLRWAGVVFQTFPARGNSDLRAVWGTGEDEIFAVGDRGRIRRFDGFNWQPEVSRTANNLRGVVGTAIGVIAVGEGGVLVRRPAEEWQLETSRRLNTLQAVWGTAADELWAVGANGTILQWDGSAWNDVDIGVNTTNIIGLHGSAADNVWAVGANSQTFRYTGAEEGWNVVRVPTPETLNGVHVLSSTEAYAVGDAGVILHWDGNRWDLQPALTTDRLNGVWGARTTDIWAVGDSGLLLRYDGQRWEQQAVQPTTQSLIGVRGRAANDVWAYGSGGAVVRYDGNQWTPIVSNTTNILFSLHFGPTGDIWLSGSEGTILRSQGATGFVPQESGTRNILFAVFGAAADDVWAVGETGTILRYQP